MREVCRGSAHLLCLKVGGQRDLGVHHQDLLAGKLDHKVGTDCGVAARAVDLLHEINVAEHAGSLHHPPQLHFTPLAPCAVGPQGRFQGMRGAHQLFIREPRFLQLLGKLAVLFHAVPFQQRHLLLDCRELLRHRGKGAQHAAVLRPGLAELAVLCRQKPAFGVGRCKLALTSDSREDTASKSASSAVVLLPQHKVGGGRTGEGASQKHEEGQNQGKCIHVLHCCMGL